MDDSALLRQYAETHSDDAFAGLVARHINLVYSVALRCVGAAADAEEVTQAVFIILARKAAELRHDKALSSWLFQTTRLTAGNFIRSAARRHHREQEAYMQSTLNEAGEDLWPHLAPVLDAAVAGLGEKDRRAIVLRFYEGRNLHDIGLALGASEAAAEKRVNRALDKLRKLFTKRGLTLSSTLLAGVISAHAVQAAPVALTATVTTTAASGMAASSSLTVLAQETLKLMAYSKIKMGLGLGLAALLVGGTITTTVMRMDRNQTLTPREIMSRSVDAYAALSSYSDTGVVSSEVGSQTLTLTFATRLERPNLYRVTWAQTNGPNQATGTVWSAGNGDNLQVTAPGFLAATIKQAAPNQPQKMPNLAAALARAMPYSSFAATTIPGMFFAQDIGDFAAPAASGRYPLLKEADAPVDGVDCYVVSSAAIDLSKLPRIGKPGTATATFWIGKQDFLIHQTRMKYVENAVPAAQWNQTVDDAIKQSLRRQNKPVTPEAVAALRPQMKSILKQVQDSLNSGVVYTQIHSNIVINQQYPVADFAR